MLHVLCVCLHTLIFTYTLHWVYFRKILKHTPHFAYNNILRNKEISKKKQAKSPKTRRNRLKMKVKLLLYKPGRCIQALKCCSLILKLLPWTELSGQLQDPTAFPQVKIHRDLANSGKRPNVIIPQNKNSYTQDN